MARSKKKPNIKISASGHYPQAVVFGIGLVLVSGLAVFLSAYEQKIFPGLRVGSISVGGLTRIEAIHRLETSLAQRRVTLTYGQSSWEPTYAELGVVFDLVLPVSRAYSLGRWAPLEDWARSWLMGQSVPLNYTWKTDSLEAYLAKVIDEIGQAPQAPQVSLSNGTFQVSKAASGLVIDLEKFQADLRPAVLLGQTTTWPLQPELEWPTVTAEDYVEPIAQATRLLGEALELHAGPTVVPLTADQIAGWFEFVVRSEGRVDLQADESTIGAFLLTLAKDLNVDPRPQEVIASVNKVEEVRAGKPGRALDISNAVGRIQAALLSTGSTTVDLPMNDVPPHTNYATIPSAPVTTGKVITVDLTKQHEYVYQDNVLVFSSKISSGLNDWTPTGNFKVYAKTKRQKMSGPDYYVPNVPDILWFKGDYSLHGVYWHNDFGIRPRSHGCVGQPLDAAAWLFDWADVGTPVVIFKS